jgi:Ankyrin repeats (3 copies)
MRLTYRSSFGKTLLHHFAAGDTEVLNYILSVPNIRLSCQDSEGNTALHWAATGGSAENVVLLLNAGAHVSVENVSWCTPLDRTLISLRADVAWVLVSWSSLTTPRKDTENERDEDFSLLDPLTSRIKHNGWNWKYYKAVAKVYVCEGNMEMTKQFFD